MAGEEAVRIDVTMDEVDAVKGLKSVEAQSKRTFRSFERDSARGGRAASRFSRLIGGLKGQFLALAGGYGIAQLGRKSVSAFMQEEQAVARLSGALKLQGIEAASVREEMERYASALQEVTVHGNEAYLRGMALALGFGATTDQAKELVAVAADLSTIMGTDLETSIRQLGKTLGGMAGELGEVFPELRSLTRGELMGGGAIRMARARFGGAAEQYALTESGRYQQALNALGDQLEKLGQVTLPAVNEVLTELNIVLEGTKGTVQKGEEGGGVTFTREAWDWIKKMWGARRYAISHGERGMLPPSDLLGGDLYRTPAEPAGPKSGKAEENAQIARLNQMLRAAALPELPGAIRTGLYDLDQASGGLNVAELSTMAGMLRTPDEIRNADLARLSAMRSFASARVGMGGVGGDYLNRLDQLTFQTAHPFLTQFGDDTAGSIRDAIGNGFDMAAEQRSWRGFVDGFSENLIEGLQDALIRGLTGTITEGLEQQIAKIMFDVFGGAPASEAPAG